MVDIVPGWLPPSRENWELVNFYWQFYPLLAAAQFFTDYYPQGKTSIDSRWNLPGKWAWFLMEVPSFLVVLLCCMTIPARVGLAASEGLDSFASLPVGNKTMAVMYTAHYLYRAVLAPLVLNPSMSPIHPTIFGAAFAWQLVNATALGGWLGGYGPTSVYDWAGRQDTIYAGMVIFVFGLLGNMFHDDDLREIRRAAKRNQEAAQQKGEKVRGVDKVYAVPVNGLFHFVLYAHFLCEWIEWGGFWLVGGPGCIPARSFLFNEIASMLPRALQGRRWYIKRFGEKEIGSKKAIIPFIL